MKTYADLVDRVFLHDALLKKLTPTEPLDSATVRRIREADAATLAADRSIGDPEVFVLVRGGLLYALDALSEAHRIFKEAKGDLVAYWHGAMHRREGDFDNARYWFRRAGVLPFFGELHRAASGLSALMARQTNWDPYLFAGECEQARFGAEEGLASLVTLQQAEFETLFDYCWRKSALRDVALPQKPD